MGYIIGLSMYQDLFIRLHSVMKWNPGISIVQSPKDTSSYYLDCT